MQTLPLKARVYLIIVCLLGGVCGMVAFLVAVPYATAQKWELMVFFIVSVLAGSKKITLMRHKKHDDVSSMSLGFVLMFAAMLRFGPAVGMVMGVAGSMSGCVYPRRQPWHQLAFNLSLTALEAWIAGVVFLFLNGWTLTLRPLETFMAVTGAVLTDFALNTGGVAIIIALCTEQKPFPLWKQTFLWTAPSYFAGACISTLAILLFRQHIGVILLFVSPVAYLTFQSYETYTARAEEKQKHIEELQANQVHLADLYLATIKSLALAIDAKDQYTHQHILRVQRYAVAIAKHMGLTGDELEGINTGALLHDIGKLGVPEYVLLKPGRLTDDEFAKIKKHPEIGAAILDPVDFPWPVLPVVKSHHEKWDGTGYPEGLKGENIPLSARILAAADVYDALTSSRSYRTAWTHEKAVAVIKKDAGTHFDPVVVEAFLAIIEGVVEEMARDGEGPLVPKNARVEAPKSKMEGAARDIQRASSELWAMYEVAQTLSSSLGLQETLEILARKLEAIFPQSACLFLLRENEPSVLKVRTAVGVNREFFAGGQTLNAVSKSLTVVESRQSYLGEFDSDDLLLTSSQSIPWTPLYTALIVPIVYEDRVLGTINLYHPEADAFNEHDCQLLEMISARAAMALYNGLLFDRTRGHAVTDSLTGLYNLRYLTEYVEDRCKHAVPPSVTAEESVLGREAILTEAPQTLPAAPRFALLCLDLDSFKPINDNFGHQKGDLVLCDLARLFQQTVGQEGIVARYGGDEFLVVLDDADQATAIAAAQRLQTAVESYDAGLVHPTLGLLHLGVSIGFACFPTDGQDSAALLAAADTRMYTHKTERKLGNMVSRERPPSSESTPIGTRIAA